MKTIQNACNVPLDANSGTVPNFSTTLNNTFQSMSFDQIDKTVVNGQVIETTASINFKGSWAPFSAQQLMMKPEGQRRWSWYIVLSIDPLALTPDDVINRLGKQYRVMAQNDYSLYGFYEYHLVEDYEGSGP